MHTICHRATDRGFVNHGWLQANHSFSFSNYYDREKIQFGALRVLNDDIIAPNMGFGMHPHENMEIITIPLTGILKHRDNMEGSWIPVTPGEIQVMSAGTGVHHSEINGSSKTHLSLFQIWILPNQQQVKPRYDQKVFEKSERKNKFQVLVDSMDSTDESCLKIHQDAIISRVFLEKNKSLMYSIKTPQHGVYVMTIHGDHTIANHILKTRDALAIYDTPNFEIEAHEDSDLLLIEVPLK